MVIIVLIVVLVVGEIFVIVFNLRLVLVIFLILNVSFLIIIKIVSMYFNLGNIMLVIFCLCFLEMVIIFYMLV